MEYKTYFKKALAVAWPALLEFFFTSLADIIDTFMVSGLGPSAVAAVGLTTQPKFIALSVFFAINAAVSALVARRQGEEDRKAANLTLITAIYITLAFVVIADLILMPLSSSILRFAGSSPDTHDLANSYYLIIMGGIVFNALSTLINAGHRGCGNTRIAFISNLVSSLVNITFNYLLIYGNFGFPKLGIRGAAIATVLGTFIATLMCLLSLTRKDSYLNFRWIKKANFAFSKKVARSIGGLGFNILVENVSMRIGFFITAVTAAKLGTDSFAAHNVGMNLLSMTFSFGNGMQVASISLTGNALGAGKKKLAMVYGKVCQRIGLIISIITSIILLAFGDKIFYLFFAESHIVEKGELIVRFLTVIVLLQISQVIYGGCLRAAGDVKYPLFVALISVTFIRSAVTLLSVNILGLGLAGIWLGILSDQASRFILLRHRFNKGDWLNYEI
ncbi:MAG: MATE family efflux transporter [Anaerococcus sp.]|nr:MATE family efflux transporter [Anaerococcus sp.]